MNLASVLPLAFVMVAGPQFISAVFFATSEKWKGGLGHIRRRGGDLDNGRLHGENGAAVFGRRIQPVERAPQPFAQQPLDAKPQVEGAPRVSHARSFTAPKVIQRRSDYAISRIAQPVR
jgi:hypothetical protein